VAIDGGDGVGKTALADKLIDPLRPRLNPDPLILYSELVWRRYEHGALADEAVLSVSSRCYAPDQLTRLITDHRFIVVEHWRGYSGEAYGVGTEL
jgi:hypothetical protein